MSFDYTHLPKLRSDEQYLLLATTKKKVGKMWSLGVDHAYCGRSQLVDVCSASGGYIYTRCSAEYLSLGELGVFITPQGEPIDKNNPWFIYNALYNYIWFFGSKTGTSRKDNYSQLLGQLGWTRKELLIQHQEDIRDDLGYNVMVFERGSQYLLPDGKYVIGESVTLCELPEGTEEILVPVPRIELPIGYEPKVFRFGLFDFKELYVGIYFPSAFYVE